MKQNTIPFLWKYIKDINIGKKMSDGEETFTASLNEENNSKIIELVTT